MKKKYFYYILFGVGLAATIDYNGLNNSTTKVIAMACFALLFLMAARTKDKRRSHVFMPIFIWYLLACVINAVYAFLFNREVDVVNQEILLPLMVAFSSYTLFNLDREKFRLFFLPICAFSVYSGVKTVSQSLGSLVLVQGEELEFAKNQMGANYASIAIICAVFATEGQKVVLKLSYLALSLLNMLPVVLLSCRTAVVGYALVVFVLIYERYKMKSVLLVPFLLLILFFIGGDNLLTTLNDSFVAGRDVDDADSISSGRVTRILESFDYYLSHPLFGFYGSGDGYNIMPQNVHMFLLYKLTKWGTVGAIPFLALYFYFFKIAIKSAKEKNVLVASLLFLAFFESLGEYAPPFGPGSCFLTMFFLVGIYLKTNNKVRS